MKSKGSIFLVLAALAMVAGIFAVNAYTAPMIEEARIQRENALYFDIVPEANGFGPYTPLSAPPSMVRSMVTMTQGGEDYALVYEASFKGWNDGIQVLFFLYANRSEVAGIRILSHNETIGIGDRLLENPSFLSQFQNLSGDALLNQGLDEVSGASAPITQDAIENALIEILAYHEEFILGIVDTTPPIIRILALPTAFNAGSTEPDWRTYFEVTNKDQVTVTIDRGNLNMNVASELPYVITATFTDPLGNSAQARLNITIVSEEEVIEIINIEPSAERIELFDQLYPTNELLTDLTETLRLSEPITNVYRIVLADESEILAYEATFTGWNPGIQILLFVRPTGQIDSLVVLGHSETQNASRYGALLLDNDVYIQGFQNRDVSEVSSYEFDSVAQSTATRSGMRDNILKILDFHQSLHDSN
jgi:Na+-translocating ferredoxin:NAD+ oxidoreductase RnfG subunit